MSALLNHKRLREEIEGRALKQEALSEKLGISDRHLRNLCSKDINVSSSLLYKPSKELQVSMDELLTTMQEESE